jgi:2-oxoisovalerate dehydrogenase E1 component
MVLPTNNKTLDALYARALLIRSVEQRLLALFAEGKLFGTVHTCVGQEWTGIAVAEALEPGDFIFTNHRGHGHYIARTGDVEGLMAEIMGKSTGICGGRGGSQHICASRVYGNGVQGGFAPVAAGMAFAEKLRHTGNIGVAFIGDGTLGEGTLYETLNFVSLWGIPLLIVLENNLYAQSTHQSQYLAGDICARAEAFGIETAHSNTWDPEALLQAMRTSVEHVRRQGRPVFHRVDTFRLMAHSKGDDNRDPALVKQYWDKDPLVLYASANEDKSKAMLNEINEHIDRIVHSAEAAPYAKAACADPAPAVGTLTWKPASFASRERVANLIYESFRRNMQQDEKIILIGEDIEADYGGAFKVTKDLSKLFPGRVRNAPISEAAIVGLGNGMAMNGLRPVCEIMFGDFLTLAMDQLLNHASKFRYMYDGQVSVPMIVRTPMGGRRGYGPTHSQSIEKHFLGMPETQLFAIHQWYCPGKFYDTLFATIDRPAIVIENKVLYGVRLPTPVPQGFTLEHTDEVFPTTRLRPTAEPDLTIVCYGGMVGLVETAVNALFEDHEILCEVIVPTQLYPLDASAIAESITCSGHLLIVEEGVSFAAFGSEVISQLTELTPGPDRKYKRLGAPQHPIPASGPLEKQLLPGSTHLIDAALELTHDE